MKLKFGSVVISQTFTYEGDEYVKIGALVANKSGTTERSVFYPMEIVHVAGRKPPRKGGK